MQRARRAITHEALDRLAFTAALERAVIERVRGRREVHGTPQRPPETVPEVPTA
jgi:hypothetical protein